MGKTIQDQNLVSGLGLIQYKITDLIPQVEASKFMGLDPSNRNSLYYWKKRYAPADIFPKRGRNVMWPVKFLVEVLHKRNSK